MEVKKGYKQTELGVIPEDWEIDKLGSIVSFFNGKAHENYINQLGNFVVVNSKFISSDGLVFKRSEYGFCELNESDIAIVMSDIPNGKALAKCFIVDRNMRYTLNQRIGGMRAIKDYPKYLFYIINRNKYFLEFDSGSGQTNLRKQEILDCPIPLPPLPEQTAIATALSDMDALIAQTEKLIEKKKAMKQGMMQELLKPKKGWVTKTVKEIVKTPVTDGPHETPEFVSNGIPFLSVNNIIDNRIDYSDLRFITIEDDLRFSRKCKPQKNDILLGKAASVGKVALVNSDWDFNIWSPLALIRVKSEYSFLYTYYYFQTIDIKNQIDGLTNSSSQGNIGMRDIEKLIFSFPEKETERIDIGLFLSDLDSAIISKEKLLQKLKLQKQGMMQELLTGRIRLL